MFSSLNLLKRVLVTFWLEYFLPCYEAFDWLGSLGKDAVTEPLHKGRKYHFSRQTLARLRSWYSLWMLLKLLGAIAFCSLQAMVRWGPVELYHVEVGQFPAFVHMGSCCACRFSWPCSTWVFFSSTIPPHVAGL